MKITRTVYQALFNLIEVFVVERLCANSRANFEAGLNTSCLVCSTIIQLLRFSSNPSVELCNFTHNLLLSTINDGEIFISAAILF